MAETNASAADQGGMKKTLSLWNFFTIGFGAISTNALNPHVYKAMAFDPRKDFAGISMLGYSTIVLEVPADTPIKSVADLVAFAKKHELILLSDLAYAEVYFDEAAPPPSMLRRSPPRP